MPNTQSSPTVRQLGDYHRQQHEEARQRQLEQQEQMHAAGIEPIPGRDLPDHCYQAKQMRGWGMRMDEIAKQFKCDRTTVWRWLRAVDRENQQRFRERGTLERVLELVEDLENLEQDARRSMMHAADAKSRNEYRREARQFVKQRMDLLRQVGLLQPEQAKSSEATAKTLAEMKRFMREVRDELRLDG